MPLENNVKLGLNEMMKQKIQILLICCLDELFSQRYCLQICVLLLIFLFKKLEKIPSKRDSVTGVFLRILQSFVNFITEHLLTAASETATENSLKNSAQNGKLHTISAVKVWLGSKWVSSQKRISKNRMKNVENKAMLKC